MTWVRHDAPVHETGEFARARARAEVEALALRGRAVRTVAGQAFDNEDLHRLLAMLGLDDETGRRHGG